VRVKCFKLDIPMPSGRIYTKEAMFKALDEYREFIAAKRALGELAGSEQYNSTMGILLTNVSHMIEDIWIDEDNFVCADIRIMDTPSGRILKEFVEDPNLVWIPRGNGTLEENKVTVKDYTLTSIDAWPNGDKQ
jgi:hypothetical protein